MKFIRNVILAAGLFLFCAGAQTQEQSADKKDLTPEEIIRKFTEKETEFYKAWMQYAYVQRAEIRVRSVDGAPSNESMTLVSEVVFNDDGSREIRKVRRNGRLKSVHFTQEDIDIIENINPFSLTTKDLPLYNLKYAGKEKVDELNCHVFAVKPKSFKRGHLYFEGRIWVDDADLQIVRTVGKAVPQGEQRFPEFETLRQIIDGKYWFPVYVHADDRLHFPDTTVRLEETITYSDYKKFESKATIRYKLPDSDDPE